MARFVVEFTSPVGDIRGVLVVNASTNAGALQKALDDLKKGRAKATCIEERWPTPANDR